MTTVAYLGPEGTFTHAAALAWPGTTPVALPTVQDVYRAVEEGRADRGVVAIENTVEGYVVPSLDALLASEDVVGIDEAVLEIAFDAFVRPGATELTEVSAHPHGLAQCQGFVARTGLAPVPAASNAAACRDATPHQVALGPRLCGDLYGLETYERDVQDFAGARTQFLLLARRSDARAALASAADAAPGARWRTMVAVTPVVAGPGVLARILAAFGAGGLNLSSLITRPLKVAGRYVFVLTVDAAPVDLALRVVLQGLLDDGHLLKTLAAFPERVDRAEVLDLEHVPSGSVDGSAATADVARELLW
ncbi:prephenate dehydratase [Luteimicrobium album]|uniref:prephenate dehydratase n=1 Tax=Luteimicrobium album TaxID=1054550 RepID=A0ABQ6HVM1_9MICO|nr:prephenate dehydratase domain-containing protein [Luteimicrobium album]GMA22400.1 prephenate dehydratase [Luteimicrobium album]